MNIPRSDAGNFVSVAKTFCEASRNVSSALYYLHRVLYINVKILIRILVKKKFHVWICFMKHIVY